MKKIQAFWATIYGEFNRTIKPVIINMGKYLQSFFALIGKYARIFWNFIYPILQKIYLAVGGFLQKIFSLLNFWEKLAIIVLFLVIIVCSYQLILKNYLINTNALADYGGSYTEGILVEKPADAAAAVDKLSKIGLTRFDNEGKLQPALAKNWELKDDNKTYIFHLENIYSAQDAKATLQKDQGTWKDMEINVLDNSALEFKLAQPYAPLLDNLAKPLFPVGPYEVEKESKTEIRLKARSNFFIKKSYLETIVLKLYVDGEEMQKALSERGLDGLAQVDDSYSKKGHNLYQIILPRWQVLFFNLASEPFKDKTTRQKLAKNERLDKNFDVTLVTLDKANNVQKAEEIRNKWAPLGVKVNIISRDALSLQKDVIPTRDYDLLLYGIDYGYDPDPYAFWHSTQLGESGLNLANFENVDADKILEEARQVSDDVKRKELYDRFNQILADEVPAIFLEQTSWQYLVSQKVKGIINNHPAITSADRYNEVWNWFIKEKRVKKQ